MGGIPNLSHWWPPPKSYLNPRALPSLNRSLQPFFNPPHPFFLLSLFDPFLPTFNLRPSVSSPTSHLQLLPCFKHPLSLRLAICDHFCKPLRNFSFLACFQSAGFPSPANNFLIHTPWPTHALAKTAEDVARNDKPKATLTMILPWILTKR